MVGNRGVSSDMHQNGPQNHYTFRRKIAQLTCLSGSLKEKCPLYERRHDKAILLHDNARPHITRY